MTAGNVVAFTPAGARPASNDFIEFPAWLADEVAGLSARALRVLLVLYTVPTEPGSEWRPVSRRGLGARYGRGEKTVARGLAELIAAGLVDRRGNRGGGRTPLAYRVPGPLTSRGLWMAR